MDNISDQLTSDRIFSPSRFHFSWRDIDFAGQFLHSKETDLYSVNLVANLGIIPFSSENKSLRKQLRGKFMPLFLRGDLTLSQNSSIQMVLLTEFSGPVSAKRLMEVITYTLMDHQDDLDMFQETIAR